VTDVRNHCARAALRSGEDLRSAFIAAHRDFNTWRVLAPGLPTWCSPKCTCHGRGLRAVPGSPARVFCALGWKRGCLPAPPAIRVSNADSRFSDSTIHRCTIRDSVIRRSGI